MRYVLFVLAMTATLLAGCQVGPQYARPAPPGSVAPAFIEADRRVTVAQPTDPRWWHLYNDPVLDALIADAFAANTDLRVAYANVARARGALRSARGGRLPDTTLSAGYTYAQSSTAFPIGTAGTSGSAATGTTSGSNSPHSAFDLSFALNYEVDLFGRVSNQINAARRDVEAERALADQMRVTVAAETAAAYVGLCANGEQEAVARRTLALLERGATITRLSFEAGRGSRLDVEQARTLAEQQRASIQVFVAARAVSRYSLAELTGRAPADLRPAALNCHSTPRLVAPIPIGDGVKLLARRPDIRAAERTLAADTARIGVATADLYPTVGLGGGPAGLSSGSLRQLFSSGAFNFTLSSLVTWAFPNREAARGRILQAQGQAAASLALFDAAVLGALRDTETALNALARELDRHQALVRARDSSRIADNIARMRFQEGLDSFLTELDADRTLAATEAALAQSDQAIAEDQLTLFRALGGGWEDAADNRGDVTPVFSKLR